MTEIQLYTTLGILLAILGLMGYIVKSVFKVAEVVEGLKNLSEAIDKLTTRVDTIDLRMYENAIRRSPKR